MTVMELFAETSLPANEESPQLRVVEFFFLRKPGRGVFWIEKHCSRAAILNRRDLETFFTGT